MGKFNGVLLASDFDNTLLNTDRARLTGEAVPEISAGNREALRYFMAEGGRFTVATGRALAAMEPFAGETPMNTPAVICNGAALYDFDRRAYLEVIMLDDEACGHCQEVMDRFPTLAAEAYPLENIIHAIRPNVHTAQHQHVTHADVQEDASLMDVPRPITKIIFEEDHPRLLEVRDWLAGQPWIGGYEMGFSVPAMLELTARGADKGGMVAQLAKRLDIAPRNVYCIGDEANDLTMLRCAAEGFAPANCSAAVRESGATIVPDVDHDAIAAVVELLDRRYR